MPVEQTDSKPQPTTDAAALIPAGAETPPTWVTAVADLVCRRLDPVLDLAAMHAAGKRRDNWWANVRRIAIFTMVMIVGGVWGVFQLRAWGVQADPLQRSIAVIPIDGPIAKGYDASADRVVKLIERACKASNVESLLLQINSPGGAPAEAERMVAAIRQCRAGNDEQKGKQIVALIDGTGASAAYMVASATDKIYAGRYSIVGSIGAIMRYTDFSELAHRYGVHEKVFRSAELKGGPSLISGSTPREEASMQEMVDELANVFLNEVMERRGEKLTLSPEEVSSGRVWTADDALAAGLIDDVAVLEDLKRDLYKDRPLHIYSTKPSVAEQLGVAQMLAHVLASAVAPRFE